MPQQTIDQTHQGEGKRKWGGCLLKNYATKSSCWLGRLEGFLFEKNAWNQITSIKPVNLAEGQSIHLCGKKIDELCGFGRVGSEGELVCYSAQQPLQQIYKLFLHWQNLT